MDLAWAWTLKYTFLFFPCTHCYCMYSLGTVIAIQAYYWLLLISPMHLCACYKWTIWQTNLHILVHIKLHFCSNVIKLSGESLKSDSQAYHLWPSDFCFWVMKVSQHEHFKTVLNSGVSSVMTHQLTPSRPWLQISRPLLNLSSWNDCFRGEQKPQCSND